MKFISARALRESSRKKLFLIPCGFTLANAFFGFLAVIKAIEGDCVLAAYCIIFSGFIDNIDGRVARRLGSTSQLGMELDTLSDAISFCLAPAIILYSWHIGTFGVWAIVLLSFYLGCGLVRLARFNTTSEAQSVYFQGLSTPIAAIFLMSLVVNETQLRESYAHFLFNPYVISGLIMLICVLMVSKIPCPTFKQVAFSLSFTKVLGVIGATVILITGALYNYPLLFLTFGGYIFISIAHYLGVKVKSAVGS